MSFFTLPGLQALAPTESSNNPLAQSSTSSASGLYQFTTGTWQTYAPQAGVDINQYPTAASAPADVQTQVALVTPISNWTCANCNNQAAGIAATPGNTTDTPQSITANDPLSFSAPDVTDTGLYTDPMGNVSGNAPASTTNPQNSTTDVGDANDAYGNPMNLAGGGWFAAAFSYLQNLGIRSGVVFFGMALFLIAVYALIKQESPISIVTSAAKGTGRVLNAATKAG